MDSYGFLAVTTVQSIAEVFLLIILGFVLIHPKLLILTPETVVSLSNLVFFVLLPVHVFFTVVTSLNIDDLANLWYIPIFGSVAIFVQFILSEFIYRFNCFEVMCFQPKRKSSIHLFVSTSTIPQFFVLPYALGKSLLPRLTLFLEDYRAGDQSSLDHHQVSEQIKDEFSVMCVLFILPYLIFMSTYFMWYIKRDPATVEQRWISKISRKIISVKEGTPEILKGTGSVSKIARCVIVPTKYVLLLLRSIPFVIYFFLLGLLVCFFPSIQNRVFKVQANFEEKSLLNSFFTDFMIPFSSHLYHYIGLICIGGQLASFIYERKIFYERKKDAMLLLNSLIKNSSKIPESPSNERRTKFALPSHEEIMNHYNKSFVTNLISSKWSENTRSNNLPTSEKKTIKSKLDRELREEMQLEKLIQYHVPQKPVFESFRIYMNGKDPSIASKRFWLEIIELFRRTVYQFKNHTLRFNPWIVVLKSVIGKLFIIPLVSLIFVYLCYWWIPHFFMFSRSMYSEEGEFDPFAVTRRFIFGFVVVLFAMLPTDTISLKMIVNYFFFSYSRPAQRKWKLMMRLQRRKRDKILAKRGLDSGKSGFLKGKEIKSFGELSLVQYLISPITMCFFIILFLWSWKYFINFDGFVKSYKKL